MIEQILILRFENFVFVRSGGGEISLSRVLYSMVFANLIYSI